jgi:hypothetical protein
MTDWFDNLQLHRTHPRLWVETLWLVEKREPLAIIRGVSLRPGLNVIWARDSDVATITGWRGAGHGVGKTSLCLLLRHCLGDECEAISNLREEAHAQFPDGGVAARVHVADIIWTVFRPFSAHGHSLGGTVQDLQALFIPDTLNQFGDYLANLEHAMLEGLSVRTLPGTTQSIEWRHVLAWCTRDQKSRFESFFRWRADEGAGFRRTRQDPPLLVKAVLGVLKPEGAKHLDDIDKLDKQMETADSRVKELEREPLFLMNHVEQQLRRLVGADPELAMESIDLFLPSVMGKANELLDVRLKRESELDVEIATYERELYELSPQIQAVEDGKHLLNLENDRLKALLAGNQQEYERLSKEIEDLHTLRGHCRLGQIDFNRCEYIAKRLDTSSLRRQRDEKALAAVTTDISQASQQNNGRLVALELELSPLKAEAKRLQAAIRLRQMSKVTSELERKQLEDMQKDYQSKKHSVTHLGEDDELFKTRSALVDIARRKQSLLIKVEAIHQRHSERVSRLSELMLSLSRSLLGESAVGWFDERSESAPFRLALGGEAYHVLEVVLGDVACLVDAISGDTSVFPSFVIHDCPREADMSTHLYRDYLLLLQNIEARTTQDGIAPFQYILTTTSAPPLALQEEPFLRLQLMPVPDESLLFLRRLTPLTSQALL